MERRLPRRKGSYLMDSSTDCVPGVKWRAVAACIGTEANLWFPKGGASHEARRICRTCPVQVECLEYSLLTRQQWGLWGGVGQEARRRLIKKNRRLDPSTV